MKPEERLLFADKIYCFSKLMIVSVAADSAVTVIIM